MSAVLILALCSSASAADGVLLPPAPSGPGGEDAITTSQGVKCSQSINSNGGYIDVGVATGGGLAVQSDEISGEPVALGYARLIIPLGRRPTRIDCSALYELEIERLRREIQLLSIGLE